MANIPDRIQKQEAKNTAFEKTTGKSHFSPNLRARKTEIAMWCDQGKNEDQILASLGGGVSRAFPLTSASVVLISLRFT